MAMRRGLSGAQSDRNFRRASGTHPRNFARGLRDGFRL